MRQRDQTVDVVLKFHTPYASYAKESTVLGRIMIQQSWAYTFNKFDRLWRCISTSTALREGRGTASCGVELYHHGSSSALSSRPDTFVLLAALQMDGYSGLAWRLKGLSK